MTLPKQVREQGEESDRLIAEALAKEVGATAPIDEVEKPVADVVKIDPNDYKSRFSLMKQKYDLLVSEELPAVRSQVSQRDEQILALTQQVAELAQKMQAVPTVSEPASQPINTNASLKDRIMTVLSDGEKETYSEDFIDMLGRVINSVQPENQLDPAIESRLERVETTQHLTAEDHFWRAINDQVPTWREMQKTAAFQAYLKKYDPLLGTTREEILGDAQEQLNAERAVAVFTNFVGGEQDHDEVDTTIIPNPLEKHVVPEDTGNSNGSDIDVIPQLTAAEIEKYYVDVALGRYKNRQREVDAMENAIRKIHSAAQPQQPNSVDNKTAY